VYPGIVDTEMQAKIRSQSKDSFIDVDKFIDFKTDNKLNDKFTVGKEVYSIDQDISIQNGSIIRIQDNR
jgi:benzil reductase ((S)-benzoin forming)